MEGNSEERSFGTVEERDQNNESEDDERVEDEQNQDQEDTESETDDQDNDSENSEGDAGDSQEQTQKTEKGTKLDPNPESAVHQQYANEKRLRSQMEEVLGKPELLQKFVKEHYGIDLSQSWGNKATGEAKQGEKAEGTVAKKWTAADFENLEDVASVVNQLQEGFEGKIADYEGKIQKLTQQVGSLLEGDRQQEIAVTLDADSQSLQGIAELNPKSPDFIPGLEKQIAKLYYKLDFDERTKQFRGNYSLREIGEELIQTAREARTAGSKKAQTIVKDKTGGQVRTSQSSNTETDTSEMTPGQSIAQGIRKMFRN